MIAPHLAQPAGGPTSADVDLGGGEGGPQPAGESGCQPRAHHGAGTSLRPEYGRTIVWGDRNTGHAHRPRPSAETEEHGPAVSEIGTQRTIAVTEHRWAVLRIHQQVDSESREISSHIHVVMVS